MPLRVLAFIEGDSVSGPARNLLEFCRIAPTLEPPLGPVHVTLATFRRPAQASSMGDLVSSAEAQHTPVSIISERSAIDFSTVAKIRALCSWVQPDIVQTHAVKSNLLVWLAGLPRTYPWLAWHHGYARPTAKQEFYNQFDRLSLRNARRVATVTTAFVPELRRAGVTSPIEIIRNAIPPEWACGVTPGELSRDTWVKAGTKLVLAVGRLSKEKAHADLVEALALLRRSEAPPRYTCC